MNETRKTIRNKNGLKSMNCSMRDWYFSCTEITAGYIVQVICGVCGALQIFGN